MNDVPEKRVGAAGASRRRSASSDTARATRPARAARGARSASGAARGEQRRKAILRALHVCVLEKGYTKTTLADIAEQAKMYPSHLLYYFNGKEAILEQYFHDVSEKILVRLRESTAVDTKQQIEMVAKLFFAGEGIKKSEIGFMLECFGVAVNDSVLREEKAELDRQSKAYLLQLFEKAPARIMPEARDCAEITYALLVGLRSAVYFDAALDLPDAYRLFRNSIEHLAGLR